MAHYQPASTLNMWLPLVVGWAEDGKGLAEVESPIPCQRLDVAGGDTTQASEYASWVPAFLAVRTGLGKKDSPWVYFERRRFRSVQTTASPYRLASCG